MNNLNELLKIRARVQTVLTAKLLFQRARDRSAIKHAITVNCNNCFEHMRVSVLNKQSCKH